MFTKKELDATQRICKAKKEDLLHEKGGSDLDYIRSLETVIKLENATKEKTPKTF